MNNITHFKLSSTFESNLGGGTLAYPNTSYIEDTATLSLLSSNSTKNYMYVEALEDDTLVSFKGLDMNNSSFYIDPYNTLEYSVDLQTWNTISTDGTATTINIGEKLYFRGECDDIRSDLNSGGIGTFLVTKKHNVGGNIMSLLFGDNFEDKTDLTGYDCAFGLLFGDIMSIMNGSEGKLVSAENLLLPATTLATSCYASMFNFCTSLQTAPELPATTLAPHCYYNMFFYCTSLTTAPELPATTLAYNCYGYMFGNCTSLVATPELPATTLDELCYREMFYGCTSLTTAPSILPATTLASECYEYMFNGCISLVTAPELSATTLAPECYKYMFNGCTSLVTAPQLYATTLATECYRYMFSGCTSLTSAPELPATKLAEYCYSSMFSNCTSLMNAPELPAIMLAQSCYSNMFNGCKKLSNITMLATDISATNCLYNWVYNVASIGTFTKHPSMISLPTGISGIPEGWTVVDYVA